MMMVVARSLSFTFALFLSYQSLFSVSVIYCLLYYVYATPDSAFPSPLRSPLAPPTQMRFAICRWQILVRIWREGQVATSGDGAASSCGARGRSARVVTSGVRCVIVVKCWNGCTMGAA